MSKPRYVIVAMTYNREHADQLLAKLGDSFGAQVVELDESDVFIRASDAKKAIDRLTIRREDGPVSLLE